MKRLLLLFFLATPFLNYAQYQIKGSAVKPDGTAAASLAIILKKEGDTSFKRSTLTALDGSFIFQIIDPGNYKLQLQSLFYRDTSIVIVLSSNEKQIQLQPIRLIALSQTLNAVTIHTKKEPIEFKDDHIAFVPAADPSIGARPVAEILNRIPGISIDGKNKITAKGQEGVQVLVNGRMIRTAAGDYLAQLNADEVERIEVYDNATRFAYIKAPIIINVVLKARQQKKLWNAALNTNTLPRFNPSADASFSFGKQRMYARVSHDVSHFRSSGITRRWTDSFNFSQEFRNKVRHSMSTARMGWECYLDSSTVLNIEGNYSRHTDEMNADIHASGQQGEIKNAIHSAPVEKEVAGFVSYKRDKKQKGYSLLELGITQFGLTNSRDLPGLSLVEERQMNNYSVGFKGEWQKNFGRFKMINGFFSQLTRIADHIDTLSAGKALKNKFNNNSITSYHEVTTQLKKWSLSAGANIDYIRMQLNPGTKGSFMYEEIFLNPSLRISRINPRHRISFSYNRKYILPGTHMLFGQYSQVEVGRTMPGNYSLRPAVQDLFKFSYTQTKKATMLFELYYDATANPVIMLSKVTDGIIVDKPENLKSRKSVGAVVSFSYSPVSFYTFTLNADGRWNDHELEQGYVVLHPATFSISSTLINRFTVNKKLSFSFNAGMHNWRTSLYRTMDKFMVYTLQGNYKVNTRLNMSFSFNDVSNNMRFSYSGIIIPGFYESNFTKDRMRNVALSLRYQLMNSSSDRKTTTLRSFMSE